MIVMKFGGSCIDKPSDIERMVEIVNGAVADDPKIVLSAFKGVTDELIKQAVSAREGNFSLESLERKHGEMLSGLTYPARHKAEMKVKSLLEGLRGKLETVRADRKLAPVISDEIVSYGEQLAVHIVSGYLSSAHLENSPLSDLEAGLMTNSKFGDASLLDESYQLVRDRIKEMRLPVIAGFFGKDKAGRIATLGRGGTDYVAAFIASALACDCVLLKDVEGILSADPKIVPNSKLLRELDYSTAIELAHYGSKVIFEKAIVPAAKNKIRILVTSFLKNSPGSVIKANAERAAAVSLLKEIATIRIANPVLRSIDVLKDELEKSHVDDLLTMVDMRGGDLIFAVPESRASEIAQISENMSSSKVSIERGRSLVALTSSSVERVEVSKALQQEGMEVDLVALSATGRSVCVALDAEIAKDALRVLHDDFII